MEGWVPCEQPGEINTTSELSAYASCNPKRNTWMFNLLGDCLITTLRSGIGVCQAGKTPHYHLKGSHKLERQRPEQGSVSRDEVAEAGKNRHMKMPRLNHVKSHQKHLFLQVRSCYPNMSIGDVPHKKWGAWASLTSPITGVGAIPA